MEKTCVIKVGSAVIAPAGVLDPTVVDRLARDIAAAHARGVRPVLVSSGAVACGFPAMGLRSMPAKISERQAAAALGQPLLMRAWTEALAAHGLHAAQVLLTADDIDFRERFVNAHRTLATLLDRGAIPIINENDSISFEEIKLGDNDRLSALVAGLVGADRLIVLSVADGVREDGGNGPIIPEITDLDAARAHIGDARSDTGVGGMATKLDAAGIAREMGASVVIASGREPSVIERALDGLPIGTRIPVPTQVAGAASRRKQWIAHSIRVRGRLIVDEGARRAVVERGASLLPSGILSVESDDPAGFGIGAAVEVRTDEGVFARGLVAYRSDEITRIRGRSSDEIERALGYTYCDEVIHRDDLIVNIGKAPR